MKDGAYKLSLLFSFLIMALGALIWGVFIYFNIFGSWIVFVSTFAAGMLIWRLAGKKNFKVYVWIFCASLVLCLMTVIFTQCIYFQNTMNLAFGDAFKEFSKYMLSLNFENLFLLDIILCGIFILLGCVFIYLAIKLMPIKIERVEIKENKQVHVDHSFEENAVPAFKEEGGEYVINKDEVRKPQKPKVRIAYTYDEIKDMSEKLLERCEQIMDGGTDKKLERFYVKKVDVLEENLKKAIKGYLITKKYYFRSQKTASEKLIKRLEI